MPFPEVDYLVRWPAADVAALPEEMTGRDLELAANPAPPKKRRKLEKFEYAATELYAGYTNLAVRTALIRSADWEPGDVGPVLSSFQAVWQISRHLGHLDHERVVLYCLNGRNEVMAIHEAAVGGLHGAAVTSRDAIRVPTLVAASGVVMVHNHPSGDPTPSREDLELTRVMVDAFDCVGIHLLDHVIVTASRAESFLERGILPMRPGRR